MILQLVNLTAHPVTVFDAADRALAVFPTSGTVARLRETQVSLQDLVTVDGELPFALVGYQDEIEGLPDPMSGHGWIVSRVLAAASPRPDLFFPNREVRDAEGRIVGCRGLGTFTLVAAVTGGPTDA